MSNLPILSKKNQLGMREIHQIVYDAIAEALPDIIDTLIEKAKCGDLEAAKYLTDRIMGKPVARTQDLGRERLADSIEDLVKLWASERLALGPGYINVPENNPIIEGEFKDLAQKKEEVIDMEREEAIKDVFK